MAFVGGEERGERGPIEKIKASTQNLECVSFFFFPYVQSKDMTKTKSSPLLSGIGSWNLVYTNTYVEDMT